ncbi:Hypothetical predicted protein, partial [Xyrichtys novacula]
ETDTGFTIKSPWYGFIYPSAPNHKLCLSSNMGVPSGTCKEFKGFDLAGVCMWSDMCPSPDVNVVQTVQ